MVIFLRKAIIGLILLGSFSTTLASEANEYQIELLLFSHITPAGIQAEHWPAEIGSMPKKTIALKPLSLSGLANYPTQTYLPKSAWNLTHEANLIQKKWNGTILYHQAWRMSQLELRKPLSFLIQNNALPVSNDQSSEEPSTNTKFFGSLTIQLVHYFNTTLQLTLIEPSKHIKSNLTPEANPCWHEHKCYFNFNVESRTRSQVLNYLDHPLYGALIEITPVKVQNPR